jgi:glycogen synthase
MRAEIAHRPVEVPTQPSMGVGRVLMTTDTLGSTWAYCMDLAGALAQWGVRIELATMGAPLTDEQWESARTVRGLSIHESTFAVEWMDDPWSDVELAGEWLTWLEKRLEPDVIHLNAYAHAALPWSQPVVVVAHGCASSWSEGLFGVHPMHRSPRFRESVAAGVACADVVVTPTAAMAASVRLSHGRPAIERVIPNGIWSMGWRGPKELFALAVGCAWDDAGAIHMFERVARRLGHPVCIAGPRGGDDGSTGRWVRRTGRLDRLERRALMARTAIFAHPTPYEPFGLAPLEAADAGCALVLSDLPSLREVWGDAAFYVAADDESGWLAAVGELIGDPHQRRRMARKALRRSGCFTATDMAARYLYLYGEMMGRRIEVTQPGVE